MIAGLWTDILSVTSCMYDIAVFRHLYWDGIATYSRLYRFVSSIGTVLDFGMAGGRPSTDRDLAYFVTC